MSFLKLTCTLMAWISPAERSRSFKLQLTESLRLSPEVLKFHTASVLQVNHTRTSVMLAKGSEHFNPYEDQLLQNDYFFPCANHVTTSTDLLSTSSIGPRVKILEGSSSIMDYWKQTDKLRTDELKVFKMTGKDNTGEGDSSKILGSTTHFSCPILSSTNYTTWAIRMQVILEANRLWDMIEPQPTTQADAKNDKTAIAYLYQALPEDQLLLISKYKTAKAV
ncbi:hypothetical protein OSB04_019163 [Centaurea solstitialis]|uniref:DUF4219 domain-containing protein n=1 Tax=Centaurea solstitialis TaxID=347529 RepID=A0AA38WC45_9ASTR|nr:hypothetical protein OSB04_019163 [Centaurea solstitialis]